MAIKISSRGQVTIFVIVALLIVTTLILFFLIRGDEIEIPFTSEFNPDGFIDQCLRESIRDKTNLMISQGGFVSPTDFKIYQDIKATYLCKNVNYYDSCIMQYPLYLSVLNKEIKENVKENIEECFVSFEEELISRNYEFSGENIEDIVVEMKPGLIDLVVFRDFSYIKNEVSKDYNSFKVELQSPLYDLASVAQIIMNEEARTCDFDFVGYMRLHPEFSIRKWVMSDSTEIYTIIDKKSGGEMNVAERGCAFPAGL